jgi:S1-C subfamily serine protease
VILAFEKHPVAGVDDLLRLLTETRVGERCSVSILRGVEKMELVLIPQEAAAKRA